MRVTELFRLVWLNINQNKFKTVMTSIGIIVGAATIVMVIGIGRGGQMDVAEQFSSLNAGAIDVSYDQEGASEMAGGFSSFFGAFSNAFGNFGGRMNSGTTGASGAAGTFAKQGKNFGGDTASGGSAEAGATDGAAGASVMPERGSMEEFSMPDGDNGSSFGGRNSSGNSRNREGTGEDGGTAAAVPGENGTGGMSGKAAPDANSEEAESGKPAENENNTGAVSGDGESGRSSESGEYSTEAETSGESLDADRLNLQKIILSDEDLADIETFVPNITGATISYTTRASLEGGSLSEAQTYTVAGVKNSYFSVSNLGLASGTFLSDEEDAGKLRVCVLGSSAAEELFDSPEEACGSTIYIADRAYTVEGVLKESQTVSAGISPDDVVFVPYQTGIKYITGENIDPTITVISGDVNAVAQVKKSVQAVLAETYSNAEFTFSDAGSKMEAAESSNEILTMLLTAMACIVFLVGGIGIMNVLFVSVKERTNEIGILKSMGATRKMILFEFLAESAAISLIGGVLGVAASFAVTPVVEHYGIRVEANAFAWAAALGFAALTGTLFGIYPAWKASRLVPVEALNAD